MRRSPFKTAIRAENTLSESKVRAGKKAYGKCDPKDAGKDAHERENQRVIEFMAFHFLTLFVMD